MNSLKLAWDFFSVQILGMKWLNTLFGSLLKALGLDITKRIGGSIQFFLYDVVKMLLLLAVLIFVISYIQSFFPPERTKKILGRFHGVTANLMGALLGTITPFCSCSSIPLFIGFTNAGLPIGVSFSFLISSPLVDMAAFILLVSVFGLKIALAYVVVGVLLAVIGGTIIDKLKLEDSVEAFVRTGSNVSLDAPTLTIKERLLYGKDQVLFIVKKVWGYVLIGVGVGALIHNWIPQAVIESIIGKNNPFSVLLATLLGIPIYSDVFATIPIAEALYAKGVEVGTILALLMAITAMSLPSIIMLRRAVKPKLLIVFMSIVAVGIIIIGYFFNLFGYLFI